MCKALLRNKENSSQILFPPETTSVRAGSEFGLTMGNLGDNLVTGLTRDACTGVLAYSCFTIFIIAEKIIALFSILK